MIKSEKEDVRREFLTLAVQFESMVSESDPLCRKCVNKNFDEELLAVPEI